MPDETIQEIAAINAKLDRIIRLLALAALKPGQSKKENIAALSSVGLAPKEIADLVGTSAHSVSQALFAARKPRLGPARKAKRKR